MPQFRKSFFSRRFETSSAPEERERANPAKLVRVAPIDSQGLSGQQLHKIHVQNKIRATMTGTRVFDRTVHKTNIWLKDIMIGMGWNNRERAYSFLRATLHTVRDLLPIEEVANFGAQLPILLRGVYYEGWWPHHGKYKIKSLDSFYDLYSHHLGPLGNRLSDREIIQGVSVCMQTIARNISPGEIADIQSVLPKVVCGLFNFPQEDRTPFDVDPYFV
jgi:uncharacterized protein (DUF2267 family)